MDLDTFLTTVYVWVDDWYKQNGHAWQRTTGRPCRMSDSEVLTLGIVGQWRAGVAWRSERGMVRWMHKHGRSWFPQMLQVSAFNARFRQMWSAFARLQQDWAVLLSQVEDSYEVVDTVPLPAFSLSEGRKARQRHWLWDSRLGTSRQGWFWGHRWLVSLLPSGVLTGWTLFPANIQDRWLLQALFSARATGHSHLLTPPPLHYVKPKRRVHAPVYMSGHSLTAGCHHHRPYLADQGFNGSDWLQQWLNQYHATVFCLPSAQSTEQDRWSWTAKRWLHSRRQIIETVFSTLCAVFNIKRLGAHSTWGQLARLAAIGAAFNLGIACNRTLNRSDLTLETLIC